MCKMYATYYPLMVAARTSLTPYGIAIDDFDHHLDTHSVPSFCVTVPLDCRIARKPADAF